MNDLEKLLLASNAIERFKREKFLSTDAFAALIDVIESQRTRIAELEGSLRRSKLPFKRDQTQAIGSDHIGR